MEENMKIVTQSSSDDGELLKLLPSDIFPVDQEVSEPKHSTSSQDHQLSCMAEDRMLSQRFGALSLVEPTPRTSSNGRIPRSSRNVERFRHEVRCISIGPSPLPPVFVPVWWLVYDGNGGIHGVLGYGTGSFWPIVLPAVYPSYPFVIPIQTWVGGFGGEAVGAVQSQQNRRVSNRLLPFPGGGAGNAGGFGRGHGGTGVFLPPKPAGISSTAANGNNSAVARKRQGVRSRHRAQFLAKENRTNPVDNKKQEDCLNLLPSEINLPTEWTY